MSSADSVRVQIIETVFGLQPFLSYPGGKSKLAKRIVNELPPHRVYVEPMIGGGSVFFHKDPSEKEVISDIDGELIGFYRALRDNKINRCDMTPNKNKFNRLRSKTKNGRKLQPCEYLYLNKLSYGSKIGTTINPGRFKKCNSRENPRLCGIESKNQAKYADRLKNISILHGDFKKIIKKYDSRDTVFYIDPPYVTKTKDYYRYGNLKPEEVKSVVDKIKGKFILSYNNSKQIRDIFCKGRGKYKCKLVKTNYTMNRNDNNNRIRKELLIKNF